MERLTTRNSMGRAVYKNPFECERCGETIRRLPDYGNGSPTEKLAAYEEAEEQGLLLRLPCKVGDTIYIVFHNHTIGKSTVTSFKMIAKGWAVKTYDWSYLFTDFGKTVFLTEAEAEAKLKEMEENNND